MSSTCSTLFNEKTTQLSIFKFTIESENDLGASPSEKKSNFLLKMTNCAMPNSNFYGKA